MLPRSPGNPHTLEGFKSAGLRIPILWNGWLVSFFEGPRAITARRIETWGPSSYDVCKNVNGLRAQGQQGQHDFQANREHAP